MCLSDDEFGETVRGLGSAGFLPARSQRRNRRRLGDDDVMTIGMAAKQPRLTEHVRIAWITERHEVGEARLADTVLLRRKPSDAERGENHVVAARERSFEARIDLAVAAAARRRDPEDLAVRRAHRFGTVALDPALENAALDRARSVEQEYDA